jgi:hypothetical protein
MMTAGCCCRRRRWISSCASSCRRLCPFAAGNCNERRELAEQLPMLEERTNGPHEDSSATVPSEEGACACKQSSWNCTVVAICCL